MTNNIQSEVNTQVIVSAMKESTKTEAKGSVSHPDFLMHEAKTLRTNLSFAAFTVWKLCKKLTLQICIRALEYSVVVIT